MVRLILLLSFAAVRGWSFWYVILWKNLPCIHILFDVGQWSQKEEEEKNDARQSGGWVRTETLKCIDFLLRWIKIKSFLFPCALFLAHAVLVSIFSATDFFFCSFFSNEITVAQTYIHGGWVLQKRDSWTRNHRCNKGSLFAHLIVCTHSKHIPTHKKRK